MKSLPVVAVHGVGVGDGKSRAGFSSELRKRVFANESDAAQFWHECVWEGLNDTIDKQIVNVVQNLISGYSLPWTVSVGTKRDKIVHFFKAVFANFGLVIGGGIAEKALDLGLDFVLYLDSAHGDRIRNLLRDKILEVGKSNPDGVVLVAHSLGSVIAYDVVAEAELNGKPLPVRRLVTFGSPLQWTFELRKAEQKPECSFKSLGKTRWSNFYYPEDYVSLGKELPTSVFPSVENVRLELPSDSSAAKSHCAYWSDDEFASCLQKIVASSTDLRT